MDRAQEIAWAAGVFEGEGWLGIRGKTSAEVVVGMTDRDVVDRFCAVIGRGAVSVEPRQDGHKTLYRWSISNAAHVAEFIALVRPWLGERRGAKADEVLAVIAECRGPKGQRTHCPQGHPYDEANTYRMAGRTGRQCITCRKRWRKSPEE